MTDDNTIPLPTLCISLSCLNSPRSPLALLVPPVPPSLGGGVLPGPVLFLPRPPSPPPPRGGFSARGISASAFQFRARPCNKRRVNAGSVTTFEPSQMNWQLIDVAVRATSSGSVLFFARRHEDKRPFRHVLTQLEDRSATSFVPAAGFIEPIRATGGQLSSLSLRKRSFRPLLRKSQG
jgi:hypothetical protein